MTTKYDIGQKVWIMWANEPVEAEILWIEIYDFVFYFFKLPQTKEGVEMQTGINRQARRPEFKVASTKEELKEIVFK